MRQKILGIPRRLTAIMLSLCMMLSAFGGLFAPRAFAALRLEMLPNMCKNK